MTARQLRPGWRTVKFGDVVRQVKGKVNPGTAGIERYVAGEHMDTDDLRIRRWGRVGDGYLGPAFTMRFQPGQVLYGSRRTYLRKVALADFEGICANTTFVVESATDDLLPEFLPYLMTAEAFHEHSIKQSKGSVNPYINFSDLKWYEFALPPLDEQARVVLAMTAHDLVASRLETLGRRAGELESSLRDSLFAASADSAEQSIAGLAVIGPQNGVTVAKNERVGDLGYVGMSVMFGDEVSTTLAPAESVSLDDAIRTKFELNVGDLLFARRSVVLEGAGRCVMVGGLERPAVFESSIIRVRVDSKVIEPSFLLHYLHSSGGRRLLKSIVRKGAVSGIAGSDLKRLSVRVPSLDQQRELLLPLASIQDLCGAIVKKQARVRDLGGVLREALLRGGPA